MEHLWVFFALLSAFALASSDALTKHALSSHNVYLIAWLRLLLSLPLLFVSLLFVPLPELDREFYGAFVLALPLEIAAMILYMKALQASPLSLTLPFLSLTPIFLIVVPYFLIGERVSLPGAVGVVCIALGSYILNISDIRKGILEPLRSIIREKGSRFMIVVAFLYSFTSTLGKKAIEHSSPLFFGATYMAALVILFTPIALYKAGSERCRPSHREAVKASFLPALFQSVMIISHMIAMSMTQVAYMISVKRLSVLIGVLAGYLFFKEANIRERFFGAVIMLTGFVLIVLFH